MTNIQECLFITVLVGAVLCVAAAEHESLPEKYCHFHGIEIKTGETDPAPIGMCGKVTCSIHESGLAYYRFYGCDKLIPREGCHLSETDLTKRYPHCCPRSVCPDELKDE